MNGKQIRRRAGRLTTSLLILAGLAFSSACGTSAPTRYYLLSSIPPAERTAGEHAGMRVGVGPIEFPEYLQRKQIVRRQNPNELQLAGLDQWAEPLQENFSRVLQENLGTLLGTDTVFSFPWKYTPGVEYQVVVSVNRFEPEADGTFVLDARWEILRNKRSMRVRRSSVAVATGSADYAAHAAAASQALAQFSRQIAAELIRLANLQR